MPDSRWSRLESLFTDALDRPDSERARFVEDACGGDADLLAEVQGMLAASRDEAGLSLEHRLAVAATDEDPLVGRILGAYRVERRIGEGGMSTVYLGSRADGSFAQRVAIKVVSSLGRRRGEVLDRFLQERRILAALVHPGIARLLDGGLSDEGQPYLVMEHVDGLPITTHCDRLRLPVRDRLALFRRVCEAVQHAHRNLVVHRDLKPSNIFVTPEGEVKLLDFGIAKLLAPNDDDEGALVTRTGVRPMTPEYAAPEQLAGGEITTATDVYALGVLAFELLTGLRPCGGATAPTMGGTVRPSTAATTEASAIGIEGALDAPGRALARSTSPARLRRLLSGDLDTIVGMALRTEPERRYASAGQLSEDVERALAGLPVRAERDTLAYRIDRFARRHWLGVGVAAAAVIALVGFLALALTQSRAVARERDLARAERDKAERVLGLLVGLFEATSPQVLPRGDRLTLGEFLPRAQRRALEQVDGQPDLAAHLRFVLGRVAHARGRFDEARLHLERAVADRRRLAGPDDPDALDMTVALGYSLLELGLNDDAKPMLQDAYDRLSRRPLPRDEHLANAAVALANAIGVRPESERLLREALAIRRTTMGPGDVVVSRSLIELGNFLVFAGRASEGLVYLEEARARLDTPALRTHPLLLTALNDLGNVRSTLNELPQAEALHRRVIEIGPQIVDPESLPVANALNNVAVVLALQNRFRESEQALRRSFTLHERLYVDPHPRVANLARNVGMVLAFQGEDREARDWLDKAIAIGSAASADPRGTAWMRAQRAWISARLGGVEEPLSETARAVADLDPPETPPLATHLAESRLLLATLLLRARRPADAIAPLEAAGAHFASAKPVNPLKLAQVDVELGRALGALGRCDEARTRLAQLDTYAAWGYADPDVVSEATRMRTLCARPAP